MALYNGLKTCPLTARHALLVWRHPGILSKRDHVEILLLDQTKFGVAFIACKDLRNINTNVPPLITLENCLFCKYVNM